MGSGLRRPAPRSRSRAKPFRVCEHCERTGRSRDRAAASPARYRDAPGSQKRPEALEGVDLAEAITVLVAGVFASTMTDGLVTVAETRKLGVDAILVGIDVRAFGFSMIGWLAGQASGS